MRVGSRWFPSSQPLLFAAPRYQAASVRPSCCSGVRLKRMLQTFIQTCLKLSSSRQTQGVVGRGFYRQRELRVQCAASALRSSAETASSELSISLRKLDCTRVGRANSSTRHPPTFQNLLAIGKQIYGRQDLETVYRNQKQAEKHEGPVKLTM